MWLHFHISRFCRYGVPAGEAHEIRQTIENTSVLLRQFDSDSLRQRQQSVCFGAWEPNETPICRDLVAFN
jgi:hypothetical protein